MAPPTGRTTPEGAVTKAFARSKLLPVAQTQPTLRQRATAASQRATLATDRRSPQPPRSLRQSGGRHALQHLHDAPQRSPDHPGPTTMAEPQAPAEDRKRKEGSITGLPTTTFAFTAVRRTAAVRALQHGAPPATRRRCRTNDTHHSTGSCQPPPRPPAHADRGSGAPDQPT